MWDRLLLGMCSLNRGGIEGGWKIMTTSTVGYVGRYWPEHCADEHCIKNAASRTTCIAVVQTNICAGPALSLHASWTASVHRRVRLLDMSRYERCRLMNGVVQRPILLVVGQILSTYSALVGQVVVSTVPYYAHDNCNSSCSSHHAAPSHRVL